jgi:glycosyltransferase involved in cell wall biosynthesis
MLVSVIICGYNRKNYIENALNSVLNQTLDKESFEIIINTNYGIDELKIPLMNSGCDFTILRGGDEPLGLYYARAINVSKGDIISFLDDDDEFAPEKLNYIVDKFNEHPDLVFINNDVKVIDSNGNRLTNMERDFRFQSRRNGEILLDAKNRDLCYKAIRKHGNFCNSSISVKTSIIKDYIEQLKGVAGAEDDFLFFSSLFSGRKLLISDRRLTHYRIHNKNKSTFAKINLEEALQRMHIEMPKALHSLKAALLTAHYQGKSEDYGCYAGLYVSYEILETFSFCNFERGKMLHLMIKYLKTKPWKLASSQRNILLICALSLISINFSRNLYRIFGLGK